MPADPKRVKAIFMSVSEAAAEERALLLDRECAGDADLRQRVEALLQAHEEPASFLRKPGGDGTAAYPPPHGLKPGQTVAGRFKLREELGQGGMGVVFVADQLEPVQRRVALKVIRADADSARMLARFEQERQALALMDHPNIAKVFDAGTTGEPSGVSRPVVEADETRRLTPLGTPYFVMELIQGVPLTTYCDEARLTPRQRLELFIPVCQAVQHAHQKGVIHRDLKPSNILVGLYDGKPVPKVIDFGVAKATGRRLSEHSIYTEVGSVIGTLEYISPEQAELNNLDIDTRSDIYALGAILYQLLTGTVPFSRKELQASGFAEMLRIIKEQEPPKPSTRLSASQELPSVAAQRQTEPGKLSKLVRGELDWIVMKALEKDRNRRYETANGFAMDMQRFLAGEPVQAVPPSAGYRLRKLARKHRTALTAAAAILLLLATGTAVSTWQAVRAAEAEREAQRAAAAAMEAQQAEAEQRRLAEANAQKARNEEHRAKQQEAQAKAVLEFLQNDVLSPARPQGQEGGLGRDVTVRRAMEAALPALEKSFKDQPLLEAALRSTLGASFSYLVEATLAIQQLERARKLYAQELGPDHPNTLGIMNQLANSYADAGRMEESLKLREETLAVRKSKLGPDHPDTLRSMNNLAVSYVTAGRMQEALKLHEEVLELRRSKLGPDHPDTLSSMNNLALSYDSLGRHAEALKLHEDALTLKTAKLGPNHPSTLASMNTLAWLLGQASDVKSRDPARALELARKVVELSPQSADYWGVCGALPHRRLAGRHCRPAKITRPSHGRPSHKRSQCALPLHGSRAARREGQVTCLVRQGRAADGERQEGRR